MKSKFDSGNWSPINGLPGQNDMLAFLKHFLQSNPEQCYTRDQLMDAIIKEFGIPPQAATAQCPNSETSALYTRTTYLIQDAIDGVRRADGDIFMKRVDTNLYQHISGSRSSIHTPNTRGSKISNKMVSEALVSVKILKNAGMSPEAILLDLSGKWKDEEIEVAINRVFA